jgi:hypothetical protein
MNGNEETEKHRQQWIIDHKKSPPRESPGGLRESF